MTKEEVEQKLKSAGMELPQQQTQQPQQASLADYKAEIDRMIGHYTSVETSILEQIKTHPNDIDSNVIRYVSVKELRFGIKLLAQVRGMFPS